MPSNRGPTASGELHSLLSLDLILDVICAALLALMPRVLPQHTRPTPAHDLGPAALGGMPYTPNDTCPTWALGVIVGVIPPAVELAIAFFAPVRGALLAFARSYVWTLSLSEFVVSCGKAYVGYYRPYFLEECAYSASVGACTASEFSHAYRSFPSGHAQASAAGMLHLSLRLLGAARLGHIDRRLLFEQRPGRTRLLPRLRLVSISPSHRPRMSEKEGDGGGGGGTSSTDLEEESAGGAAAAAAAPPPAPAFASVSLDGLVMLLCLLPAVLALWIGASRVVDNAHHPADVVAGFVIGASCAATFYFKYFHAPFGAASHTPRRPWPAST